MNDNLTELKTQSGHTVFIKSSLKFKEFQMIQSLMTRNMKINPETGKMNEISGDMMAEANTEAMRLLVVKVTNPDGSVAADPMLAIGDFSVEDGLMVVEAVNKVTEAAQPHKKKVTS